MNDYFILEIFLIAGAKQKLQNKFYFKEVKQINDYSKK